MDGRSAVPHQQFPSLSFFLPVIHFTFLTPCVCLKFNDMIIKYRYCSDCAAERGGLHTLCDGCYAAMHRKKPTHTSISVWSHLAATAIAKPKPSYKAPFAGVADGPALGSKATESKLPAANYTRRRNWTQFQLVNEMTRETVTVKNKKDALEVMGFAHGKSGQYKIFNHHLAKGTVCHGWKVKDLCSAANSTPGTATASLPAPKVTGGVRAGSGSGRGGGTNFLHTQI